MCFREPRAFLAGQEVVGQPESGLDLLNDDETVWPLQSDPSWHQGRLVGSEGARALTRCRTFASALAKSARRFLNAPESFAGGEKMLEAA